MSAKVLIVDDEPQLRRMLRIALKSESYIVFEAAGGEEGLQLAARHLPDLMVLDLGLPDMDGHQVLQELRRWSSMPVVVLSVRNGAQEKVMALDQGAQDYVTKPFSVEELLARVRAHLRDRGAGEQSPQITDGHLKIDRAARRVSVAGEPVELTPKEYAVLAALASAPNKVVTQTMLLETIWGAGHRHDTHYLRIVISHLRRKLGDDSAQPHYLKTEAGIGYRLVI